jgi:hypothetical protein
VSVAAYDPDQSGVDNLLLVGGLGEFPEVQGSSLLEDGPPAGATWKSMRQFSFGIRVLDLADATGDGVPDALLSPYLDPWSPSWDDERGGYVGPSGFGWRLHIADLDGDGRGELIITETNVDLGAPPVVHVAWGGGT